MASLSTEVIIAISLGCIVILIITAFIFTAFFFRNRLKKFLHRNNLSATYKPSLEEPDQSISTFETTNSYETTTSRYEFIKSCARKHLNQEFDDEFKSLPDYTQIHNSSISRAHVNRLKNRYSNIEAFNHSRVILSDSPEKSSGDDYINANFVQGFTNSKKFIATQGPKPETIIDFWRMICMYKVKAIVMLTNIMENGVLKCHQYWPDEINKTIKYGSNQVTLIEAQVCGDYVKRRFDLVTSKLTKDGNKKVYTTNTVTHYYYQKWFDRGVPDTYPISILKLVRDVNQAHSSSRDYPIVVHCSAGVGRTGTYITLDAMLENLNTSDNYINIHEFVSKIRMQRSYLVQTLAQYVFIHDSLNDYCIFGFTDIKSKDLANVYESLKQNIGRNSKLWIEFNRLNIQKSLITDVGVAVENCELNRDSGIMCFDENRCQLTSSGYINASVVLNSFIVTQDPMQSTIHQFWRMVSDYNAKIVLSLNSEFISEYDGLNWPTPENPCCQIESENIHYEIKLLDKEITENPGDTNCPITTRYFKIVDLIDRKNEFYVTNVVLNESWITGGALNINTALDLVKRVAYFVELFKDTKIVIHGWAGGANCILICALYVLVDQLMLENSVDIFNVVKFLHTQRFNAKINYEQYDFLYKCLTELASSVKKL